MKVAGASLLTAAGTGALSATGNAQSGENEFTVVEDSPTTKTLFSAVNTAEGPYAVGAGGDVLARGNDGWRKVVEYGPQARSRPLKGADVTDDGRAVWFVGGSGVIGEFRVDTNTLTNYSAPKGKTSTWEDVAVVGTAGKNERLYFVNGSGELLVGVRQESGAVKYREVVKPGGGSTIPGIDFRSRKKGHVISTSQLVTETTDGGKNWSRIGIDFAGNAFYDVASVGASDVNVTAGGGIVYRYDGFRWTPHVIDDARQAIRGIDRDGEKGFAVGAGGKVYERQSAGQWTRHQTPTDTKFNGGASGPDYDVAVGTGGTIVERAVGGGGGGTTTTTTTATTTTETSTSTTATETDTTTATTSATSTTETLTSTPTATTTASTTSTTMKTSATTTTTTGDATTAARLDGDLAPEFTVEIDPRLVNRILEGEWIIEDS
ncbi:WD40/YVTN/BNR-like repeat-containing protein [Halorussus sp. GCM10023401]|uniref:WD40/YVTN/BNR-like repeat-containing protein n=1 Tax=Halorussus sp. GCM10023401 TaxID=3252680 RepID=UPI0036D215F5